MAAKRNYFVGLLGKIKNILDKVICFKRDRGSYDFINKSDWFIWIFPLHFDLKLFQTLYFNYLYYFLK